MAQQSFGSIGLEGLLGPDHTRPPVGLSAFRLRSHVWWTTMVAIGSSSRGRCRMGFLDKAKAAATELSAKADQALSSQGLAGPSAGGKQTDKYFRDLGVLAYLEATGRPADAGERDRIMSALQGFEGQGAMPSFALQTTAPPPPGAVAAGYAAPPPAPGAGGYGAPTAPPPPPPGAAAAAAAAGAQPGYAAPVPAPAAPAPAAPPPPPPNWGAAPPPPPPPPNWGAVPPPPPPTAE